MGANNRWDDSKVDEALEQTFPASDPPANTVETGIRITIPLEIDVDTSVTDNTAQSRFELNVDGHVAYLEYERTPNTLTLLHTEVPPEIRGRHIADRLVEAALAIGRSEGRRLVVICPFARAYLRRHRRDV
ncbi:MAG TPA: GNAT family N-acetyltransferase [Vicinamibacterales bacterium]|nr:GNAT family N-acetyltransferase [Vicinamibacterales bacterium]